MKKKIAHPGKMITWLRYRFVIFPYLHRKWVITCCVSWLGFDVFLWHNAVFEHTFLFQTFLFIFRISITYLILLRVSVFYTTGKKKSWIHDLCKKYTVILILPLYCHFFKTREDGTQWHISISMRMKTGTMEFQFISYVFCKYHTITKNMQRSRKFFFLFSITEDTKYF